MLGAICGDVIGRPYEFEAPTTNYDFELFTDQSRFSDDTVMTAAVADAILNERPFDEALVEFGLRHIEGGYGKGFKAWLLDVNRQPGTSYGNGSGMRASPVGWLSGSLAETIGLAWRSAMPSHGHPEGIKGAIAAAAAVRLALEGKTQEEVRSVVASLTGYDMNRSVEQIRANYPRFKVTCQDSVPEAIICAIEATSYEDAVRKAVSLGNDADTQAAIAGSIAEVYFGVPDQIAERALATMTPDLRQVYDQFVDRTAHLRPAIR
ncbi:ADP-ribosylglycohydrolase family protein [Rhizobium laguerreae]|uniref:ADP-ribosylglycohydrolase family protein n=1 Tax=Rhizobium laguerreae TaxID=1076926 RepID=UPI001C8FD11D|nr:ADP-ribosylglycohydrolase family protein [Rhizobium laguerreae]MBY3157252.1 ADP-ribosylglycohydrolase family protein [Rhizobium laguerreae]